MFRIKNIIQLVINRLKISRIYSARDWPGHSVINNSRKFVFYFEPDSIFNSTIECSVNLGSGN